jgi:hypothetical protein
MRQVRTVAPRWVTVMAPGWVTSSQLALDLHTKRSTPSVEQAPGHGRSRWEYAARLQFVTNRAGRDEACLPVNHRP